MSTSVRISEAIGGVFRGFVETLVESASRLPDKDPPVVQPRMRGSVIDTDFIGEVVAILLQEYGFVEAASNRCTRHQFDDTVRIRARHRCGAWAITFVDCRAILADRDPGLFLGNAILELGCYCVPREASC